MIIDEATQALEAVRVQLMFFLSSCSPSYCQVCWIPIFKAQKLILAGDPMQLPPTTIFVDKGKEAKEVPSSLTTKSSVKSDTKKPVPPAMEGTRVTEKEAESSDEDSQSDKDEGDPEPVADPEEPLGSAPGNAKNAGSKAVLRPPRTLKVTLFERLEKMYGPGIKRMLTIQYRLVTNAYFFDS